jgi:8-oxo-dGTP pyrophosphatase MutT (NUDIX family)
MPGGSVHPMSVPNRDAATGMLIRDALDEQGRPAIEVCMLRRNLASEFVAGAYVFPGGSVDPEDRGSAAEGLCRGRTDAEASEILGIDSGGLAFWVAALRECFEEAGVMLAQRRDDARPDHGALLDTGDPDTAQRFAGYRRAVNAGTTRLLDVCRQEELVLAADHVHYVSHWITPEGAPKRYDTRFFITAAPPGQVASHDDGETIATIWVQPGEALARNAAGDIELLPPTISNLKSIGSFRSTDEVMAWARQVTDVPTVLPIVLIEDGHLLILRPGDSGYEEALADRLASGPGFHDDLSDAARAAWGPRADTA